MKISDIYKNSSKTVLSFEVFPPKKTDGIETVYKTLDELKALSPEYISVTYGAGGSSASELTANIASYIKNKCGIESMAHLTCVNSTKEDVLATLKLLKENNIENILALRGDKTPDMEPKTDFTYASDLVKFIKANGDFGVSGACYPETHFEAPDAATDIRNLKHKVEQGVQSLVSQLFFDNSVFYAFLEKCRIADITVPVTPGIMPVTNKKQIERMVTLCGATMTPELVKMLQKYEADPDGLYSAGIEFAVNQIRDLMAQGADGVHIYTMNNPKIAKAIVEAIK